MPVPKNQWYVVGSGSMIGLGPVRMYRPSKWPGTMPVIGSSVMVISLRTGPKLPSDTCYPSPCVPRLERTGKQCFTKVYHSVRDSPRAPVYSSSPKLQERLAEDIPPIIENLESGAAPLIMSACACLGQWFPTARRPVNR